MNWDQIKIIFHREMRDQLRDRRTLFTIVVLPLVLYPLLGMVLLQMTQFTRVQEVRICVAGKEHWPEHPRLFESVSNSVADSPDSVSRGVEFISQSVGDELTAKMRTQARIELASGQYDLWVFIPKGGKIQPSGNRDQNITANGEELEATISNVDGIPSLYILGNRASERSLLAERRFRTMLAHWQQRWLKEQLRTHDLDPRLADPISVATSDIAPPDTRSALLWSKILPFVMLIWALTGAFYPAIDLCAGEKERGTLETLLSSPANRREIVWGKLLTVYCFSICTALLNLTSMQVTASVLMRQFGRLGIAEGLDSLGPLPISSLGWLIVILLPMSALFSALALAIAALARSSKEGQYYLMPMLLVCMPLVLLPMLPGMTLSVGTCVLPITGAVMLARSFIEGQYHEAWIHAPFVVIVTASCCILAAKWAEKQFESESVLFRENERFGISSWLRHLWRDRASVASPAEAILCGLVILVALFFGRLVSSDTVLNWDSIARSSLRTQIALVLGPSLLMATVLTRSLRPSMGLRVPRFLDLSVCVLFAVCLHPLYSRIVWFLNREYSMGSETQAVLEQLQGVISAAPWHSVWIVMAIIPAICEELTFRGFIFNGLKQKNNVLRAILISALFFGFSHGMLQQSIAASMMGIVLGMIAWKTGGVFCGLAFHVTHNTLSTFLPQWIAEESNLPTTMRWAFSRTSEGVDYSSLWLTVSVLLSLLCAAYIWTRKEHEKSNAPSTVSWLRQALSAASFARR